MTSNAKTKLTEVSVFRITEMITTPHGIIFYNKKVSECVVFIVGTFQTL